MLSRASRDFPSLASTGGAVGVGVSVGAGERVADGLPVRVAVLVLEGWAGGGLTKAGGEAAG